jgi:hypothetical protein
MSYNVSAVATMICDLRQLFSLAVLVTQRICAALLALQDE